MAMSSTTAMNSKDFWQNFKLGEEQEIACNFIYNGLRDLHEIDTLNSETEIFPILYNLSIGLERLFKVAIVLLEFDDETDINKFERDLITHNHINLFNKIKKSVHLSWSDQHVALLNILSTFYKTNRYDRFCLSSARNISNDKNLLHLFLKKNLNIKTENDIFGLENSFRIKRFIGKIIKRMVDDIYSIIQEAARSKNLYTYEISSAYSKAGKVLLSKDSIVFDDEDLAIIEVLCFLISTKDSVLMNVVRELEPLSLDPGLDNEYLQFLINKRARYAMSAIDEIEECYLDIKDLRSRLELLKAIKNPAVNFEDV